MSTVRLFLRPVDGTPTRADRDALLTEALGADRFARIRILDGGKPFIASSDADPTPPHFSITHTNGLIACAVSDVPVGIDAEPLVRSISEKLRSRILAKEERTDDLLCTWVQKEAYLKLTGDGVRFGMANCTVADGKILDTLGRTAFVRAWKTETHTIALASFVPIEE